MHRGSAFGTLFGDTQSKTAQPSQALFESHIFADLRCNNPPSLSVSSRPLFIEAESRLIGRLMVPAGLMSLMQDSAIAQCIEINVPLEERVRLIRQDYAYLETMPQYLLHTLEKLKRHHSQATITRWTQYITSGDWNNLVTELLVQHYDPLYLKSRQRHYANLNVHRVFISTLSPESFASTASKILKTFS
jgi:tRNA 2-selenouridine synthase